MKGRKKREVKRRIIKSDRKINQKNKNLIIDKILSYNPIILEGIEAYKCANRDFTLLIFLSALLIDFPLISIPCCILSMFFITKMLQFIRYKSINNIVVELAKDLSYKGIYSKAKLEEMLDDFKFKYGQDANEYNELIKMLDKYEALVIKIEYVLKTINAKEEKNLYNEDDNITCEGIKGNQYTERESNCYYENINDKLSVFYKKEDGEIKKVNKAIEFFDVEDDKSYNGQNTVVLKNRNMNNKDITIYLYKKPSILQKNAL